MNIILSIDYETFGDGSGSMNACMLNPLNRMLELTSQYDALLSVFVETMGIQTLQTSNQYKIETDAVCKQLQMACQNGHDIQLHLHPQWQGAKVTDNQLSALNAEKWRIGNLPKEEVTELIKEGKQWLEDLISPVCPSYQCIVFRAGGWCIQPSTNVIEALQKNNILVDSTIAPGAKSSAKTDWYDFSNAPLKKAYWTFDKDVMQPSSPSSKSIYELPITTGKIGLYQHLKIILNNISRDTLASDCVGSYSIPGVKESRLFSKLRKLSSLGNVMLDISTMPAETLIKVTQEWQQKFQNDADVTVVAIGHTKNFSKQSAFELEKYLQWAKEQNHQFITYKQWLKKQNH